MKKTWVPSGLTFSARGVWSTGAESVILAAEDVVQERTAAVEQATNAGHVALADACLALEEAQHAVERLYARWQELEAKRG